MPSLAISQNAFPKLVSPSPPHYERILLNLLVGPLIRIFFIQLNEQTNLRISSTCEEVVDSNAAGTPSPC